MRSDRRQSLEERIGLSGENAADEFLLLDGRWWPESGRARASRHGHNTAPMMERRRRQHEPARLLSPPPPLGGFRLAETTTRVSRVEVSDTRRTPWLLPQPTQRPA